MPEDRKYTEQDMVRARREGFVEAANRAGFLACEQHRREASRIIYPLPKVTRPRVVKDPLSQRVEWCVLPNPLSPSEKNVYQRAYDGVRWSDWRLIMEYPERNYCAPLPERVALWADLLANPTEECDE